MWMKKCKIVVSQGMMIAIDFKNAIFHKKETFFFDVFALKMILYKVGINSVPFILLKSNLFDIFLTEPFVDVKWEIFMHEKI